MTTKHTATDSKGQVHKRTSQNRVYSHAVVTFWNAIPANPAWNRTAWDAHTTVSWASSLALAQKQVNANARFASFGGSEIVEAKITK